MGVKPGETAFGSVSRCKKVRWPGRFNSSSIGIYLRVLLFFSWTMPTRPSRNNIYIYYITYDMFDRCVYAVRRNVINK